MTAEWFGAHYGRFYQDESAPGPTPVGQPCIHCGELIEAGDDGFLEPVFHFDCKVRRVIGGVNHILRKCSCCGGSEPPDPDGMTKRQAAKAATAAWATKHEDLT